MKTLSLLSLAAGAALIPAMALAQPGPRAGGGAGVSWQGGGAMRGGGGVHVGGGHRGGHVGGGVRVGGGHRGGHVGGGVRVGGGVWGGGGWTGGGQGGGGVRMPRFRPGHGFPRRLQRGTFIHPFWFSPQFYIQNWQGYGFVDPGADRRWVRYYDDAYLIDRGGRVVDAREGLDWDQYGERWEVEGGVPSYYGRNEFQPGDEDYAYVEERGGERHADARGHRRDDDDDDDDDRDDDGRRGHHDRDGHGRGGANGGGVSYGHAQGGAGYAHGGPAGPGYGMPAGPGGAPMVYGAPGAVTTVYGGGYGYGMYAYPIIIETTTTTGGGMTYSEEIIEETIVSRPRARRRARCNCTRPRPPAGERG